MSVPVADALWPHPGDDQVAAADRSADRVVARALRAFPKGLSVGYAAGMPTTDSSPWAWHWVVSGRAACGADAYESTVEILAAGGVASGAMGGPIGAVDCDTCAQVMVGDCDPTVRAAAGGVVSGDVASRVARDLIEGLAGLAAVSDADPLTVTALLDVPAWGLMWEMPSVRGALACLVGHPDGRVRAVLAWSAWSDADVLRVLAGDRDAVVRDAVSRRLLALAAHS